MKVKCVSTTGKGLNKFTMNNSRDTEQVKYPLKKDDIYTIYGQHIYNNILGYLIIGTYENLPSWYPAELFEVIDHQVHLEWYYNYEEDSVISALWGYKEMVLTDNHYDDLIERTDKAKRIFLKRKKEIDEFLEYT
ncbi:hypothetical protein A5819_000082 [Enterococcus sp. 7E2_DIV0204]|uniref:phosphoribosylaminoimidazole synthetase n=1 Tax=Enterococcus sp. 7E2_DIV0204 TaxID=1834188 RepID=UPI000A35BF1C|nr:phosphoribosylaminoimidazole synthetase [Enterococcus sp. 7E2_DIV0204]OTN87636.1 hypothetical protein A5819_000082 [Enterococcus sp. 7E2_DIV0204]